MKTNIRKCMSFFFLFQLFFGNYSLSFAEAPVKKNDFYTETSLNIVVTKNSPEFTLKLKSNPTTGFAWYLREYSRNLIQPVKHSYQKSSGKLIGAPGYELWTFRVTPAGFLVPQNTALRMVYIRPWQGMDNSSQLVYRITMMK